MINATSMLVCSPVESEIYNITVTCTVHPDGTANQCVMMAVDDDGVAKTGNVYILQVTCCFLCYICIDFHTCICRFVATFRTSL